MRLGNFLRWEKVSGEPLTLQDVRLTPQARVLSLQFPFASFVWNHPVALVVERGSLRETRTIPDVTLTAQVLLALALLLLPILFLDRRKGARQ